MRVLAALAAALAIAASWPGAEAAEVRIEGIPFACETADGRVVKPRHGDIDGLSFTDLPAQRQRCLDMVEHRIAACRSNVDFASDRRNRELTACLPVFERRARLCATHFAVERGRCDAGGSAASGGEGQTSLQTQDPVEADSFTVDPADRLMELAKPSNVRAGPGRAYSVVTVAAAGAGVRVTGEVRDRDWMKVVLADGGAEGFVYGPLLKEAPASFLEPFGPGWSIAGERPCQVWNHGNRDYEPFTWSGACADGRATGEGRLTYRGGEGVYVGAMLDGRLHGYGVMTWSGGMRYEGMLHEGRQHGRGTLVRANGDRYEGEWHGGRPHGQGTYTTADGTAYAGVWRDGCLGGRDGLRAALGTSAAACGFEPR